MRPPSGRINRVEQAVQAGSKRRAHRYDLHRVGRTINSFEVFADHRSESYRRIQVQTWRQLLPTAFALVDDTVTARHARFSANSHVLATELCRGWSCQHRALGSARLRWSGASDSTATGTARRRREK